LLRLEPPHRPTVAHHVPWTANLGASVLIREAWYDRNIVRYGVICSLVIRTTIIDERLAVADTRLYNFTNINLT
jgi:hypothetical protein